jgi:hypothetical protein
MCNESPLMRRLLVPTLDPFASVRPVTLTWAGFVPRASSVFGSLITTNALFALGKRCTLVRRTVEHKQDRSHIWQQRKEPKGNACENMFPKEKQQEQVTR